MEREWVEKKSGERYNYRVFRHKRSVHRVRVGASISKIVEKDNWEKKLTDLLNSANFRRAIFTTNDIVAEFERRGATTNYKRVRRDLLKLVESGLATVVRKNRKVYFINSSKQERLDYIIKKLDITLEDTANDGTFERHYLRSVVLNDSRFPLRYIQFRATGDNVRNGSKLSFSSYDITRKEKAVIYFLEDAPQMKRILIEPHEPIQSYTKRTLSIDYFWPEIGPSYTFTSPTPMDFVGFSLVSRYDFDLKVSRTNSGRTVVEDLSSRVISTMGKDKLQVNRFEIERLPSFVVLKFMWKRHEKT
ncbi:MAG: hypothetical protein M1123_01845 [Candidatus Thermoplasmatota archaeon]|nr:hypothetical protein [Candidatus Thermoplasmatota archaeon]MCL5930009.1 hypothetical protein [Candidatus Thermoplasmatota archaeon]